MGRFAIIQRSARFCLKSDQTEFLLILPTLFCRYSNCDEQNKGIPSENNPVSDDSGCCWMLRPCPSCSVDSAGDCEVSTLEQLCRDILDQAIKEGIITFNAEQFVHAKCPQELTGSDCAAMANIIQEYLSEKEGC